MQNEKGSATAQTDYLMEALWLNKGILSNLVTFILTLLLPCVNPP